MHRLLSPELRHAMGMCVFVWVFVVDIGISFKNHERAKKMGLNLLEAMDEYSHQLTSSGIDFQKTTFLRGTSHIHVIAHMHTCVYCGNHRPV